MEEMQRMENYEVEVCKALTEQLKSRRPGDEQSNHRVFTKILFGKPGQEIRKLVQQEKGPKLMVFGKHQLFHFEDFSWERYLPFNA